MQQEYIETIEGSIASKMQQLNDLGYAVIYAITGGNGTGKTHLSKQILTRLPFHQSFNLGLVTKTIRCLTDAHEVTILENFKNQDVDTLFSHIIEYACHEYQHNGVNVLIDGVQIDTLKLRSNRDIIGGVILEVSEATRLQRNDKPTTHFKRKLAIHAETDVRRYIETNKFAIVDNDDDFTHTYVQVLKYLGLLLDKKIREVENG